MLSEIFDAILIIARPDRRIETDVPWPEERKADGRKTEDKRTENGRRADVHVTPSGRLFTVSEYEADGNRIFEMEKAEVHTDIQGRHPDVTPEDRRIMGRKISHPDAEKAAILKPLWAQGLTASQAADSFKGQRGYGKRTIAGYFAAFSAALSGEGARGD